MSVVPCLFAVGFEPVSGPSFPSVLPGLGRRTTLDAGFTAQLRGLFRRNDNPLPSRAISRARIVTNGDANPYGVTG